MFQLLVEISISHFEPVVFLVSLLEQKFVFVDFSLQILTAPRHVKDRIFVLADLLVYVRFEICQHAFFLSFFTSQYFDFLVSVFEAECNFFVVCAKLSQSILYICMFPSYVFVIVLNLIVPLPQFLERPLQVVISSL